MERERSVQGEASFGRPGRVYRWRGLGWVLIGWGGLTLAAGEHGSGTGGAPMGGGGMDQSGAVNLAEVVADLIGKLSKSREEALDACHKLAQPNLKRYAVPELVRALEGAKTDQQRFYLVFALSLTRDPAASRALLPILKDAKADRALRKLAIDGVSGDELELASEELQQLAVQSEDGELRFLALRALSLMLKSWTTSEAIWTKALEDERDDVRQLAAKVCFQAATRKIVYYSAEPKLVKLAEGDAVLFVRANAISALARYRSRLAVPALVKILLAEETPETLAKSAFSGLSYITEIPFHDKKAVSAWWEKKGREGYKDAKPLQPSAPGPKQEGEKPPPAGESPVKKALKELPPEDGPQPLRGVPVQD